MLTNKQRNYLRKLSNSMEPIFRIGKGGLTDNMIEQMNLAFEARELFKVYVLNNSDEDVRAVCEEITEKTHSDSVLIAGNKFVLYRRSEEKPKIVLPD